LPGRLSSRRAFPKPQHKGFSAAMEAGITDHVWTIEEMLDKVGLK
jgi:hypothetical protein